MAKRTKTKTPRWELELRMAREALQTIAECMQLLTRPPLMAAGDGVVDLPPWPAGGYLSGQFHRRDGDKYYGTNAPPFTGAKTDDKTEGHGQPPGGNVDPTRDTGYRE